MVGRNLMILVPLLLIASSLYAQSSEDEMHNKKGLDYCMKGQLDSAIAEFTSAIQVNPSYAKGYVNRGMAYVRKGKYAQGLSDISKAIEIDPAYIEAYSNRAFVYFLMQKYDKSWEDVHQLEALGGKIKDIEFLKQLKQASGREK